MSALQRVRGSAFGHRELASPSFSSLGEPSPSEPGLLLTPMQSALRLSSARTLCSPRSVGSFRSKAVTFAYPLSDIDTITVACSGDDEESSCGDAEESLPFHERFRDALKEYRAARDRVDSNDSRSPPSSLAPTSPRLDHTSSTLQYIRNMSRRQ
eukprot:Hpha_TRINITY_DN16051_c4_g5::TRINITY_DN16051_c4_g5_i1::g.120336::m.120336